MEGEDRFADLGRARRRAGGGEGGRDRRSAAEQLAELDEREPEPRPPGERPPAPRRGRGRYMWVVGLAFTIVVVLGGLNLLRNTANDENAVRGLPAGDPLPDFAAPLATGGLDGDANVRQDVAGSSGAARPACRVRGPDVVNVCELRRRPLVLTFIVTRGADCAPQLDVLERVRREFPSVGFAGVVSVAERADVARLVRERGWTLPVAVDPDGAVINLYRVGICPTTTFAEAGGRVRETRLGLLSAEELRRSVRALLRAPR